MALWRKYVTWSNVIPIVGLLTLAVTLVSGAEGAVVLSLVGVVLAASVLAGPTGTRKIHLFPSRFTLVWEDGRLKEVGEDYSYNRLEDGDALFPEWTLLQLLFGDRSIDELILSYADLYTNSNEALVLLRALFPRRPSQVIPMG